MSTKEIVEQSMMLARSNMASALNKTEKWLEKHKAVSFTLAAATLAAPIALAPFGFAEEEKEIAKGIAKTIITIICVVFAVIAVFNLVVAIGELSSAGADDGPAKSKATNKIAWSIAGIFIPAIIFNLHLENQIVKFIDLIK